MTRSFLVKVLLPQQPGLRSGMFGRLFIPTGSVTPLTVSQKAIQKLGAVELVWVVFEQNRPERRYVRTGRLYEDRVEILSGLKEGERVVLVPPGEVEEPPGDEARSHAAGGHEG
jgi:multidrug efflux pump subunit AcrA (membrane-fusion protein)